MMIISSERVQSNMFFFYFKLKDPLKYAKSRNRRIVGGYEAVKYDHPYMLRPVFGCEYQKMYNLTI